MAERRMFSKSIAESDAFCDLPSDSKLLYFLMGVHADDEGFLGNTRSILRCHAISTENLELLVKSGFIIQLDRSFVIRHWLLNNQIRRDRFRASTCDERERIFVDINTKKYIADFELQNLLTETIPLAEYRPKGGD